MSPPGPPQQHQQQPLLIYPPPLSSLAPTAPAFSRASKSQGFVTPMEDSFLDCFYGCTLVAASLGCAYSSRRCYTLSQAILSAAPVPLTRGAAPLAPPGLADGSWVSVSGEVACASEPLQSYNKDACVVLEEVLRRSQLRLDDRSHWRRAVVESRSVRDIPWLLAPPGGAGAHDAGIVAVPRDAVRLAAKRDVRLVRDLSPGGVVRIPRADSTVTTLLKALSGVVDEEADSVHAILPLGVPATVLGAVSIVDGRVVGVGLHPLLGLLLMRRQPGDLAQQLASSARWRGVGAALLATLAAAQLWSAALTAYPSLPPLRRAMAEALTRVLGPTAAGALLPRGWLHLQNPAGQALSGARPPASAAAGSLDRSALLRNSVATALLDEGCVHPADSVAGDGRACVVCTERRCAAVLTSCGHLTLCMTCALQLVAREAPRCPMCRAPFTRTQVVQVFEGGATTA